MSNPIKFQTPRARVNSLGSAKSGTQHAWHMRLTAFALMPLTIAFVFIVVKLTHLGFADAQQMIGSACPAILLILFVVAGAWHMKLGMQAIIEDYVHSEHLKSIASMSNICFSALISVSAVYAILRLSFLH
jgi:succinate dehydrogenase / fumarate reductase membrane anchor subunit